MTFFAGLSKREQEEILQELEILKSHGFDNAEVLPVDPKHGHGFLYSVDYAGLSMCADSTTFSFLTQSLCPDDVRQKMNMYRFASEEFNKKIQKTGRVLLENREREKHEGIRVLSEERAK